ncbi:hypothetical protein QFZ73_001846 [Peribacillus sp. V2I11]|nr:hypothetical protein [Peribacillus sp. V2I11]
MELGPVLNDRFSGLYNLNVDFWGFYRKSRATLSINFVMKFRWKETMPEEVGVLLWVSWFGNIILMKDTFSVYKRGPGLNDRVLLHVVKLV